MRMPMFDWKLSVIKQYITIIYMYTTVPVVKLTVIVSSGACDCLHYSVHETAQVCRTAVLKHSECTHSMKYHIMENFHGLHKATKMFSGRTLSSGILSCAYPFTMVNVQYMYMYIPFPACIGPVKHLVHSGDAILTQGNNISPRHDSIVHTRVNC